MEKSTKLIILVIVFLLVVILEFILHFISNFDYLVLEQFWPVTEWLYWKRLNQRKHCKMPEDHEAFMIHGLWPSRIDKEKPPISVSKKFNQEDIAPILSEMELKFPNVHEGSDNNKFWEHEWKKHGTCALTSGWFNSILDYFTITLQLNEKYSTYEVLKENGIIPSKDTTYSVDKMLFKIEQKFGKTPQINCKLIDDQVYLHSVRYFFDKELKLLDCKSVNCQPTNCPKDQRSSVYYPSYENVH